MSEQTDLLREQINRNREELILGLFNGVEFEGIDQNEFLQECLQILQKHEKKQYKLLHAYELQKVHDSVMYGGLGEI